MRPNERRVRLGEDREGLVPRTSRRPDRIRMKSRARTFMARASARSPAAAAAWVRFAAQGGTLLRRRRVFAALLLLARSQQRGGPFMRAGHPVVAAIAIAVAAGLGAAGLGAAGFQAALGSPGS